MFPALYRNCQYYVCGMTVSAFGGKHLLYLLYLLRLGVRRLRDTTNLVRAGEHGCDPLRGFESGS
jgi:hypothetical protein